MIDEQTPRALTLRDVNGQAILVDRADIEELKALPTSLMPDGLLDEMKDDQIRDLFAFLMSRAPSVLKESGLNEN